MTAPVTKQSFASIVRQVIAVLASVYGVLSATVSQLHLPPAVSAILTAAGPVILAIEHFVADPSTGSATAVIQAASAASPDVAQINAAVHVELARLAAATLTAPPAK